VENTKYRLKGYFLLKGFSSKSAKIEITTLIPLIAAADLESISGDEEVMRPVTLTSKEDLQRARELYAELKQVQPFFLIGTPRRYLTVILGTGPSKLFFNRVVL
jgi:hypothetical protein